MDSKAKAGLPLIRRHISTLHTLGSDFELTSISTRSPKVVKDNPIKFLRQTREGRHGSMETYRGPVGNDAKLEFYETFIHLPLFTERNRMHKLEDTPNIAYLGQVNKQKLKPEPFGIVRRKGPDTSIDIHQYGMGDIYAEAFSEAIGIVKDVETLNLEANRLSDSSLSKILNRLQSKNVKRIILSENTISSLSTNSLGRILNSTDSSIKILELENTHMSRSDIATLCKILADNKVLVKLSLAKNNIGELSMNDLKEFLIENQTLKYLDLHWNTLGKGGSLEFFEGLKLNESLKHLDLSWNSLGKNNSLITAKALAGALINQQHLQHLDISHNYFNQKECEILAEALKENHKLYGIHVEGNDCTIDAKGYIHSLEYINKTEPGHLHNRIMNFPKFKPSKLSRLNCWVCEKWAEVTFTWKPDISGPAKDSPIYVYLECDNFKPTLTQYMDGCFTITRMVPPGLLKFFFSSNQRLMRSKEYKTKVLDSPLRLDFPMSGSESVQMSVGKVNVIYIEAETWSAKGISVKPRNDPKIKEWTEVVVEKIPWEVNKSEFYGYMFDSDEVLEQCISFDFDVSNIKDIIQDPKERGEVQGILKGHYRLLSEAYRQLSATSGIELFNISKNVMTEFLKKCGIFSSDFNANDFAILWNLSNAPQSKGEAYNAGNGFCRYEFSEFMIRLSIDKFYKTKKANTIKEAFEKLLAEHMVPGMAAYDQSSWKTENYLIEDVDVILKAFKPVLEGVYVKYSAMGKGPLETMNLHEFRLLCNQAGIVRDNFAVREIDMCFRQAMMTEVDEVQDGDHLEMSYVEFLEAISRVAYLVYIKSSDKPTLDLRLNAMMPDLIKVCPENILKTFQMPNEETYYNMKYSKKTVVKQEIIHQT